MTNPFCNELFFEISTDVNGKAEAELINPAGKTLKKNPFAIATGVNRLVIENTQILQGGIYFLRVSVAGKTIQKRVIKLNQ